MAILYVPVADYIKQTGEEIKKDERLYIVKNKTGEMIFRGLYVGKKEGGPGLIYVLGENNFTMALVNNFLFMRIPDIDLRIR